MTAAAVRPAPPAPAPAAPTLLEYAAERGLRLLVLGPSKDPNAKVTVLLVSPATGQATLAVKVPTTDGAARAVAHERALLEHLRGALPPWSAALLPTVVGTVDAGGREAMVMTALGGTPMTTRYLRRRHVAARSRVAADLDAVGGWLARFQEAGARGAGALELDAGVARALARRFRGDAGLPGDLDRLGAIHDRLRTETTPVTPVHGDLWMGNVLLAGRAVVGIVDWEAGTRAGEPVRDLARFAVMYALYLDRRTRPGRPVRGHPGLRADHAGAALEHALGGAGWFPELLRGFVAGGLSRLGASPERWRDVVLAGVAEVAALTDDPGFARTQLALFRRLAGRAA